MVNHITEFERKGFPLTTMDIQKLTYESVVRNNIKHSFINATQKAGKDWWIEFKKQHQYILTILKSQALSIQREIHLNKRAVKRYFQLPEIVMEETLCSENQRSFTMLIRQN